MNDELRITIAGVSDLPEETRLALCKVLTRRGRDLLDEAGRLEAELNSGLGAPMITPTLIDHANTWRTMGYSRGRKNKSTKQWLAGSGAATFVGGYFTNNMSHAWGAIGFCICFIVAAVTFLKGTE